MQRHAQLAAIGGGAVGGADQHHLVVIAEAVPRDRDEIGRVGDVEQAVVHLEQHAEVQSAASRPRCRDPRTCCDRSRRCSCRAARSSRTASSRSRARRRSAPTAGSSRSVSWNVRLRMMMFVRLFATLAVPRMSNQAPRIVALRPRPTIVVFEPRRMRTRACCAACEATRAASSGPVGATRPHTAGSYVARNASSV